ncbi:hypothetical protein [Leptospira dzoumogneensis]|uniref:LIC_13355 family lipoprotein n=1 Tax=Leptospira dzoumogneensis TaxID=2484904 RepID=A0A4Z1AGC6_9LEPT|nr:hypothetical protein [Leptospira dzoumogneensis]TGM97293.1 hypothetical protein EHR06_14170 [Leptospira dzoumogneensis]
MLTKKLTMVILLIFTYVGCGNGVAETNKRNTQDLVNVLWNISNTKLPGDGCRSVYSNMGVNGKINGGMTNLGGYVLNNLGGSSLWSMPDDTTIVFTENLYTYEYQNYADHNTFGNKIDFSKVSTYTYASRADLVDEGELYPGSPKAKNLTYSVLITGGPQDGTNYTYTRSSDSWTGNYTGIDLSSSTFSDSRASGYLYYETASVELNGENKENYQSSVYTSDAVASYICP